jgi:hypothetical protein
MFNRLFTFDGGGSTGPVDGPQEIIPPDPDRIGWLESLVGDIVIYLEDLEKQPTELLEQMLSIPKEPDFIASRYDTDDEYVLHLWKDGKSFDIRISK